MKTFKEVRAFYRDLFLGGLVLCDMTDRHDAISTKLPDGLDYILGDLVDFIGYYMRGERYEMDGGYGCGVGSKEALARVTQGLKEVSANPEKYLPKVWEGSFEEELFTTGFWAFTFWEEKLKERAEVGYMLDYNKIEFGISGYSEKLNKFLPYYFTTFSSYTFMIDPVEGQVYRSKFGVFRELRVEGNKLYNGGTLIAVADDFGGIELKVPFELNMEDLKAAEREKKRAEGKKVKETAWLSTELGYLRGKHKYIRSHTFICLMVYGFDWVKYSLMESGSIMSVDHTNAKHNDNRVNNLSLTSRSANTSKRDKQVKIFDFSLYFGGFEQVEEVELEEEKENCWCKEPTEEEYAEFIALNNAEVTIEDIAELFGSEVIFG